MRRARGNEGNERGQITVMTIGFVVVLGMLLVVVVNSSAAFLQRRQLDNWADGAAVAAADGLSREVLYEHGRVELSRTQARQLVGSYIVDPSIRVTGVSTSDDTVTVRLERRIELAIAVPGWPSRSRIRAEATAQLRTAEG